MVIGSDLPKEIGRRYNGKISDAHGVFHEAPYVVLKEATIEDWERSCLEEGASLDYVTVWKPRYRNLFFYRISVD
jgi:hypothetical protein